MFRHASDEFIIVANSYRYSHRLTESPLYFGIVDFDEGSDIFQLVSIIFYYFSLLSYKLINTLIDIVTNQYRSSVHAFSSKR